MASSYASRSASKKWMGYLSGFLLVSAALGWEFIQWTVNYHYVPVGFSMRLRYKGPPLPVPILGTRKLAEEGRFAAVEPGTRHPLEVGVLEDMVGPGRHFYCPLWWECKLVPDIEIKSGEVGIVNCLMGKDASKNQYLVDGDIGKTEFKGTLRKVLPPGRYRLNDYAYSVKVIQTEEVRSGEQIKHAGWISIPTGYVGVVTNLTAIPASLGRPEQLVGIQNTVLQPGLYLVNPQEQQVDIVFVGYRETTLETKLKTTPAGQLVYETSGEPVIEDDDAGIGFPSKDGFRINLDFTAIWGVWPDQAANVIREYGNIEAVEKRVVDSQIQSICRNMGSDLGAVELLVGESRTLFQEETSKRFHEVLEEKNLTVLTGLVKNIYIPQVVRTPIQEANIATELKLTREQEQVTAQTEGLLREAEAKVKLATEEIAAETEKLVAERQAKGEKEAEEIRAETKKLVAAIDREIALLEADATRMLGQATAESRQLSEEAKAGKFKLAVEAFGSGDAYNRWVFAQGLPDDIQIQMIYAGTGTFWTDLKGFSETMLGKQASESSKPAGTAAPNKNRATPLPVVPSTPK